MLQGTKALDCVSSPMMAEAIAIRSALFHALDEAGFSQICIKSGCQALVAAISSKRQPGISAESLGTSSTYPLVSLLFPLALFREI